MTQRAFATLAFLLLAVSACQRSEAELPPTPGAEQALAAKTLADMLPPAASAERAPMVQATAAPLPPIARPQPSYTFDAKKSMHEAFASRAIREYQSLKADGTKKHEICTLAGKVAALYERAENADRAAEWNAIRRADCASAALGSASKAR